MPLVYDPEFAAAMAPMAEAMAARPVFPPGDALSRRAGANAMLSAMISALPDNPNISRTEHIFPAQDGTQLTLSEFRRLDTPKRPSKAMYYIHGGGMILGSVDIFEKSIAKRASDTGIPIFAISYRLAPEHPDPTPVNDCWAGLQWLSANATNLGVDPAKILIMGESAGGGLAAGTALKARDNKLSPPLLKQILIFPMLDDRNNKPFEDLEPVATWKANDNITGWGALLGDKAGSADLKAVSEYAAPARAEDLSGLPPTYIDCGQLDIFIFEDTVFASRLIEARVPTEFHTYPGMPHGFMGMAPTATYSKIAAENVLRAIAMA